MRETKVLVVAFVWLLLVLSARLTAEVRRQTLNERRDNEVGDSTNIGVKQEREGGTEACCLTHWYIKGIGRF